MPQRHPGSVAARAVLERSPENVVNFLLGNIVTMDVRLAGFGIDVEAEFHSKRAEGGRWRSDTRNLEAVLLACKPVEFGNLSAQ